MIKLTNIYKIYENGTVAVRSASLEFPHSGMIAIVGTSGCGKSTLLNLLANNDIPSKGEILYNGKSYADNGREVIVKDFAYIYQDFKLIDNLTAFQNIMIGHELANKDIHKDFVIGIAEKLGITEILDQKVFALSGGQMQRVAIARAMARNPKVIFADEPTGNLDSTNSVNVYEILKEISNDILVVIVSHDKSIYKYADRVVEMQNGKVVNDNECDFSKIIEQEKPSNEILDTEINYIKKKVQNKQVKIEKHSKIGSNIVLSYKKGKNKRRNKQGLSLNSTLGLTIAFNNKGIAKKIILSAICVIMIAFILMTSAVIFSSYEQTFYNNMKKIKPPFISYYIYTGNRDFDETSLKDLQDFIKNKYGAESYAKNFARIHNYIHDIKPADEVQIDILNFCLFNYAIFTDIPNELGLKYLYGAKPTKDGEIAISKFCYEQLKYVGKLKNVDGKVFDFNKQFEFGKYIDEFKFTITGVFDDRTNVDMAYLLSNDEEYLQYLHSNDLITTVVMPASEERKIENFAATFGAYQITYNKSNRSRSGYAGYLPLNDVTKEYYYKHLANNVELEPNEIIVADNNFVSDYERNNGKKMQVGQEIELTINKIEYLGMVGNILEQGVTKSFIVKDIIDMSGCGIIMNEHIFKESPKDKRLLSDEFFINSKYVTPKFLKDVKQYFYKEILGEKNYIAEHVTGDLTSALTFNMINFEPEDGYSTTYIKMVNNYIGIPLFIINIFVVLILLCVIMSDTISGKGRHILILKSMGANQSDIIKIFSINIIVILLMQFILGIIGGFGLLYGLNIFWAQVIGNYHIYFNTFWIGWENMLLTIVGMLLIASGAMWYSLQKLNGKNLRKLFQKQKK